MKHVAGYTVAHDVSARDWQLKKNGGQWLIGKTFDTYCPFGPALVTTAALSGIFSFSLVLFCYCLLLLFFAARPAQVRDTLSLEWRDGAELQH